MTKDAKKKFSESLTKVGAVILALAGTLPAEQKAQLETEGTKLNELKTTVENAAEDGDVAASAKIFAGVLEGVNEAHGATVKVVEQQNAKILTLSGTVTELQTKVGDFEAKVTAGELVTKEQAVTLAGVARQEGEQAAVARFTMLENRRTILTTAGLPLPPENVLLASEEEFTRAKTTAAARMEEMKKRGFTLSGHGKELLPGLAYADEGAYAGQVALVDAALKTKSGNQRVEPVLGGGGGSKAVGLV